MLPSDHSRYLSLNLARTGGTSLGKLLRDSLGTGQVVTEYGPDAVYDSLGHLDPDYFLHFVQRLDPQQCRRIRVFLGHLPFLDLSRLPFKCKYVVFLRNPVAKIVSGFLYGNLAGLGISPELLEFGLHLSCSWINSTGFANPMLQVLMPNKDIKGVDVGRIDELLASIDHLGMTEVFEWSCSKLLGSLGMTPPKARYHLNKGLPIQLEKIPATTIRAIKRQNAEDILLYNRACEMMNLQRERENLPPLPLCSLRLKGPFSSGDYHPHLSCEAAFGGPLDSAWTSSVHLLQGEDEFIGYDFGPNRRTVVKEVRAQVMGAGAAPIAFAIEASNDGFVKQSNVVCVFEAFSDGTCHTIRTGADGCACRMWRLRRISGSAARFSIAALSFESEQPFVPKDPGLVQETIDRTMSRFNVDTYSMALTEARRTNEGVAAQR
jgi:hypothetical protein